MVCHRPPGGGANQVLIGKLPAESAMSDLHGQRAGIDYVLVRTARHFDDPRCCRILLKYLREFGDSGEAAREIAREEMSSEWCSMLGT